MAGPGRVLGYVVDVEGFAVSGARVALSTGLESLSADDGFYVFEDVAPGVVEVMAAPPGHTSDVETVEVLPGQDHWVDLLWDEALFVKDPAGEVSPPPSGGTPPGAITEEPVLDEGASSGCRSTSRGGAGGAAVLLALFLTVARFRETRVLGGA